MSYSGVICPLLIVAFVALWWALTRWSDRRFFRWTIRPPRSVVCIDCQGRGWIAHRERTLHFADDGFTDVERPSTMCATCGGTGRALR